MIMYCFPPGWRRDYALKVELITLFIQFLLNYLKFNHNKSKSRQIKTPD